MAQPLQTFNLNCRPGIHRDWTGNSSTGWTNGQFTRFLEGRPKKIGGWSLVGSISSLDSNNNPYLVSPQVGLSGGILTVGTIRAVKTFPIDGKFIVVVAADIIGALTDVTDTQPEGLLVPSGIFIGESNDQFSLPITFYPVRFEKYFLFNDAGQVTTQQVGFLPGEYNWSIEIFGVTSGGSDAFFTANNPTGGGGNMSSLALVVHPSFTTVDKNSPNNSYVYFGLLSDLLNTSDQGNITGAYSNYALDGISDIPVYAPVLFPMTQYPVSGTTSLDPSNVFLFPQATDPRAIYCTSEVIVSGGVKAVGPFLMAYGNNGLIRSCSANNPSLWNNQNNTYYTYNPGQANDDNVDNYKCIASNTVRGGAGLSTLVWTTNSLWLIQFTGGQGFFSYTNISNSISTISPNCTIEASGIYYWVGEDRFYAYSGAVQPVPNQQNFIWFYNNLNYQYRSRVFAFKVPHYNEIWWVFPKGTSSECNHAIVFNYVEQYWYDTPWERTAGYYDQAFYLPLLAGGTVTTHTQDDEGNLTPVSAQALWLHETGTAQVVGHQVTAYDSFITSCDIGLLNGGPAAGKATFQGQYNLTFLNRLLPDLNGQGTQYIRILARQYPQDSDKIVFETSYPFDQEWISIDQQGRLLYVTFGCNATNSDFHLGRPNVLVKPGDQQ